MRFTLSDLSDKVGQLKAIKDGADYLNYLYRKYGISSISKLSPDFHADFIRDAHNFISNNS